jgi:hypothetical protein
MSLLDISQAHTLNTTGGAQAAHQRDGAGGTLVMSANPDPCAADSHGSAALSVGNTAESLSHGIFAQSGRN